MGESGSNASCVACLWGPGHGRRGTVTRALELTGADDAGGALAGVADTDTTQRAGSQPGTGPLRKPKTVQFRKAELVRVGRLWCGPPLDTFATCAAAPPVSAVRGVGLPVPVFGRPPTIGAWP